MRPFDRNACQKWMPGRPSELERCDVMRYGTAMRRIILAAVLLAACNRDLATPTTAMSRDSFITIYVELSRARTASPPDSFPSKKEEILRRHNVTEEDLRKFVHAHGQQPDFMADVWKTVRDRLSADTVAPR